MIFVDAAVLSAAKLSYHIVIIITSRLWAYLKGICILNTVCDESIMKNAACEKYSESTNHLLCF